MEVSGDVSVNIAKVVARSREAVSKLGHGVAGLMKKHGIRVRQGFAQVLGGGKVAIKQKSGSSTIAAKHIILATGASARPVPGLDEKMLWTARDAMLPKALPKSLLIIGSGAIGIEFASFYSHMGSKVSIVEMQNRILPLEDKAVSEFMQKILQLQGVEILTGGVIPNTHGLGLENTKATLDERGFIVTDDCCRTAEPNLYAIGDVAGPPCLAHKASHEAVMCVEGIATSDGIMKDKPHPFGVHNIPSCIYSIPQVASIGLTEEQARAQGLDVKVGVSHANCSGKAIVSGAIDGFVKVIIDSASGELLGAHMVGEEVTEMINGYVIGKQLEATDLDLLSTIFPHPTLSEMMHEAVLAALGRPLNG
ncbi:hypothetical protein GH714_042520 [Hevea brasiliensis]|uniref:Dihydrolipoyl dehydrogenase n=1 Tax=Hevea brasiliensis TaxID=3981 RepID=A0A6A6K0V6_HEVBR|nr:hypothetical protein GH714_042520 [Hevea brasiliensis]